jgi:NCAIR mutase (PurE)-related protein
MEDMSYDYKVQKQEIMNEAGQVGLLATAFKAKAACAAAGVVTAGTLISGMPGVSDSWRQLAVVDRLVELGYLSEVRQEAGVAGQHRIFRWVGP